MRQTCLNIMENLCRTYRYYPNQTLTRIEHKADMLERYGNLCHT